MSTTTPIDLSRFPEGSTVERRDSSTFVWYPQPERVVVRYVVPPCCPTCGRALEPTATVNEAMAI